MLFNDEALTSRSQAWAKAYVGEENVEELDLWMAAEDFAYGYIVKVGRKFLDGGVAFEIQFKGSSSPNAVHQLSVDIEDSIVKLVDIHYRAANVIGPRDGLQRDAFEPLIDGTA